MCGLTQALRVNITVLKCLEHVILYVKFGSCFKGEKTELHCYFGTVRLQQFL